MAAPRPPRVRAAPARLHDEQASQHEVAALLARFRNPMAAAVVSSDSDEESDTESGPEEGEERKESDRRPPAAHRRSTTPVHHDALSTGWIAATHPSTSSVSSSRMTSSMHASTTPTHTRSNASMLITRTNPRRRMELAGQTRLLRRSRRSRMSHLHGHCMHE